MRFKDWLDITEGGAGSGNDQGTKYSATGLNAGGRAGESPTKPGMPQKIPPSPFSPSDVVPKGWKPTPGPGATGAPQPPRKPGLSGAGLYQPPAKIQITGGSIGGGSPGIKTGNGGGMFGKYFSGKSK